MNLAHILKTEQRGNYGVTRQLQTSRPFGATNASADHQMRPEICCLHDSPFAEIHQQHPSTKFLHEIIRVVGNPG